MYHKILHIVCESTYLAVVGVIVLGILCARTSIYRKQSDAFTVNMRRNAVSLKGLSSAGKPASFLERPTHIKQKTKHYEY